jgi:hypothetical protein
LKGLGYAVSAFRAPVLLLFIFVAVAAISAAQSHGDGREVVQASEILGKIERGEPVFYFNKIIEGNLSLGNLKLPEIQTAGHEIHTANGWVTITKDDIQIDIGKINRIKIGDMVFLYPPYYANTEYIKVVRSMILLFNCLINDDMDFSNAQFLDSVFFVQCELSEKANFDNSQFNQPAIFYRTNFNQPVDFHESNFNRNVSFSRSSFNQSVDFQGSNFNQSTDFSKAKFNQSAYFESVQFSELTSFKLAKFGHDAYFWQARFNQSAGFPSAQFNGITNFGAAQFGKDANFDWSYLNSADFNQTVVQGDLSLKGSRIETLNLNEAQIGDIILRSWDSIGHMEFDEMAYQLLLSSFRNRNLPEEANECYYDYRDGRRATLNLLYRPVDYALMLFYGYGVKPERPVIWAFVFMAIFAALFWWRQGIIPVQKGEPKEEAARFTLLEAMAFSAMTFFSGGKLVFDPPEYRIAPGKPWRDVQICKALFVWERLVGMILLFMFAVAVTKTIILGS